MESGIGDALRQVRETVEGATDEEIRDTERRLREMAEEPVSAGAVGAFVQAMAGDEEEPERLSAAERARLRQQRKRERQGRRKGRRFNRKHRR